jgi:very-short-patch-repair endonuclease
MSTGSRASHVVHRASTIRFTARVPAEAPVVPLLPQVFRGQDAVVNGWLTPGQLRGPRVRRVLRGVYAPAHVPLTHDLVCAAAGLLVPASAGLTGRSAATVLGVELAHVDDPVEVAVPERDHFGPVRGLLVRRVCGTAFRTTPWSTWRLVDAPRMCFDLCARFELPRAVAHVDAVARAGYLDIGRARTWFACSRENDVRSRENDVRAVRAALALADARSESPKESELRVVLHRAGIPVVPQHVVEDATGRFVARVDLAVPAHRVAVEYDGEWHANRRQLERDRERLNRLREAGWTVVSVTAGMLRTPQAVVEAVQRELAARIVRA